MLRANASSRSSSSSGAASYIISSTDDVVVIVMLLRCFVRGSIFIAALAVYNRHTSHGTARVHFWRTICDNYYSRKVIFRRCCRLDVRTHYANETRTPDDEHCVISGIVCVMHDNCWAVANVNCSNSNAMSDHRLL